VRVAVKRLAPDVLQAFGSAATKCFWREVQVLGSLHHPHLLPLLDSCPEKGILVYELMEGGRERERERERLR
jgi:serine/threonine protein kinase